MSTSRRVVALDARRLVGNRRGIGLYVYNLVRFMPLVAPDIDFLLLVDRALPSVDVPPGCRQVVVGGRLLADSQSMSRLRAQLYSVYWMNVLVPRTLKRERVDLFHGMNVAVPLTGRCLCISTIHDLVSDRVPGTFSPLYVGYRRWLVPAVTKRSVHVVAVSESTKNDIVELAGVAQDKITTVYNGVDEGLSPVTDASRLASARKRFALPDRFILTVGAVERQKRLGPFLTAAAPLLKRGLVDAVVLAGEKGRGFDEVEAVVSQLGISDKVRFLGYVPSETIPALYTLARCSVYPSWYEGFGLPVIEAMACGTPVITSNASSLPEVAGDAALLVPPGDVEALRRALERLLTDDRLRADLAAKGMKRATRFRWRTAATQHVEVYRRFLPRGLTIKYPATGTDELARG